LKQRRVHPHARHVRLAVRAHEAEITSAQVRGLVQRVLPGETAPALEPVRLLSFADQGPGLALVVEEHSK
jgi:hypothetical protein